MTPPDATALHVEGVGDGPTVVLLHGFTQTGRLWSRFGEELSRRHRLVVVDLPGHGGSGDVRADLPASADLVVASVDAAFADAVGGEDGDAVEGRPFAVVGYSLGGRVALHLALAHAGRIRRLVLIGATGGIEDPDARARRRARDEATASALEESGDLVGFLDRWLANPMFAGLREHGMDERRRNTPAGLASSLRLAGTGTQEPLWRKLGGLPMPVLALAGADDPRFVWAARRLADGAPAGSCSVVPGAGHAAHLHQPTLTARLVSAFLDEGDA